MAVRLPEEDLAYSKLKHFPRSINKHLEVLECGDSIVCILPFSLNRLFPLSCVCL
ncbi:AGAP008820-PA [Anopheles gambiae str. PEST]|uniref:AGAP008820-PA n=1 Tax=Anopheles gambiae TaxID=7165 RepID=Q5TS50_ANOGA|nr:AGAP008820-PA [Anopheles gambiae str. PEST]